MTDLLTLENLRLACEIAGTIILMVSGVRYNLYKNILYCVSKGIEEYSNLEKTIPNEGIKNYIKAVAETKYVNKKVLKKIIGEK